MSSKAALGWTMLNAFVAKSGIAYVGQSHWPTTRGGDPGTTLPVVLAPPGGMASGDLVCVVGHTETNVRLMGGPWAVSNAGGQSWSAVVDTYNAGSTGVFSCVFDGTWDADPSFTHDGFMGPASIMAMVVFRGVNPSTPWDDGPYVTVDVAGATQDVPKSGEHTWTVNTAGALAICGICVKDLVGTATINNGFTGADGTSDIYWNADGTPNAYNNHDLTMAFAMKGYPSPGSPSATITLSSAIVVQGCLFYGALKPA